jgi:hypothetical protein
MFRREAVGDCLLRDTAPHDDPASVVSADVGCHALARFARGSVERGSRSSNFRPVTFGQLEDEVPSVPNEAPADLKGRRDACLLWPPRHPCPRLRALGVRSGSSRRRCDSSTSTLALPRAGVGADASRPAAPRRRSEATHRRSTAAGNSRSTNRAGPPERRAGHDHNVAVKAMAPNP